MLYVDGLLNDKEFTAKEQREVIMEAFEEEDLPIEYIVSVNITDPKQIHIILEAMDLVTRKNPNLADKAWLAYVQGCMALDSDKVKQKAAKVLKNISPVLTDCDSLQSKEATNKKKAKPGKSKITGQPTGARRAR